MFSFDITLLIQAFHFFIAWWLIDRYLFRSVMVEVEHEKAFHEGLKNKMQVLQDQIKTAEREKEEYWQTFKNCYKQHIPAMVSRYNASQISQNIDQNNVIERISETQKEHLVTDVASKVAARIAHDI